MKLWGCLTVIFYLAQPSESAWNERNGLILNKRGGKYYFPQSVEKADADGGSYIQYKNPQDHDTQTFIFCTFETKNEEIILKGKLLPQDATQSISCPERASPVKADQKVIENPQSKPCGTAEEKNGYRHRVYYKLYETDSNGEIMEDTLYLFILYEYCYHDHMKEILYTEYTIETPQLLANALLQQEQIEKFSFVATESSPAKEEYENNIYNLPRPVGVPEFMPFALSRKPFYMFESSAPLNKELIGFWSEFILNIREKISKKTEPIKVYSGIYDRKRVHGASQYLSQETVVRPSPYAYWVLLYNHNLSQGVSLIMHNYAFDIFEKRHKLLCGRSVCTEAGLEESLPNLKKYKYAMAYCCPASTITDLYGFEKVDRDTLFTF